MEQHPVRGGVGENNTAWRLGRSFFHADIVECLAFEIMQATAHITQDHIRVAVCIKVGHGRVQALAGSGEMGIHISQGRDQVEPHVRAQLEFAAVRHATSIVRDAIPAAHIAIEGGAEWSALKNDGNITGLCVFGKANLNQEVVNAVPSKRYVEWDVVPPGGHHANAAIYFGEVLAMEIGLGGI